MTARNISVRMDEQRIQKIDDLAKTLQRSRAWVINAATEHYLAHEEWFIQQVELGLTDANAGKTISSEDVFAGIQQKIDQKLNKKP